MIKTVLTFIGACAVIVGLGIFAVFLQQMSERIDQLESDAESHKLFIATLREDVDKLKKHKKKVKKDG